jgi:bacteriophage N4 adsorption protein B
VSVSDVLRWLEFWQHELLLFSATWFLIGGIDELGVDIIWITRRIYRYLRFYRKAQPQTTSELETAENPGLIVVFVPTWQEASVIGAMLRRCNECWAGGKILYRIYVGCYPNDTIGAASIINAIGNDMNTRMVLCDTIGPTTKADCLNWLWQALIKDELATGIKAKAIVLHDAEDFVHPDELAIFDRLIEKAEGVQLPVIPEQVARSLWISGHYCDEFAVAHSRNLVVREAIGAALPLAGVGCAIDRIILGRIALSNQKLPFDVNSVTEDYELGLRIGEQGGRTMLVRIRDDAGNLVGTRACFPDTVTSAVRQKGRWIMGIALAGWDRMGWAKKPVELWMRLHDRKAIFTALVLVAAYACLLLSVVLAIAMMLWGFQPNQLPDSFIIALWINGCLMVWRLIVRAAFVWRSYGFKAALISIPRSVVSNIIAIMAARRAAASYLKLCIGGPVQWDKTEHSHFPKALTGHESP